MRNTNQSFISHLTKLFDKHKCPQYPDDLLVSSRISKSTSCKRNLAIWTLVCSPQESFEIGKCSCSLLNQKYFKISICKSYFWYASFAIIHSISSPCSWIKAIGSHSPVSSKCLISSSLSTVFVTFWKCCFHLINHDSLTIFPEEILRKKSDFCIF